VIATGVYATEDDPCFKTPVNRVILAEIHREIGRLRAYRCLVSNPSCFFTSESLAIRLFLIETWNYLRRNKACELHKNA
jgi:hypothetical protein